MRDIHLFKALLIISLLSLTSCGGGDSPTQGEPSLNCTGGVALAVGATINGQLQLGDELDIDGAFLDRYALTVSTAGTVQITMRSGEVDSFLWLLDSGSSVLDFDDDTGGGVNGLDAQISRSLARGCYLVETTSIDEGETGSYTVTTQRL